MTVLTRNNCQDKNDMRSNLIILRRIVDHANYFSLFFQFGAQKIILNNFLI